MATCAPPFGCRIRGVSLGAWLVLEKWMTPDLFEGVDGAEDEKSLFENGGANVRTKIEEHREHFITLSDFQWLVANGVNCVRIPLGHWCLERHSCNTRFLPTQKYVDRALQWAIQCGLKVVLDMHGAPGSQNGEHHSGEASGRVEWLRSWNRRQCLAVLVAWAQRWGMNQAVIGIGLANEVASPKASQFRPPPPGRRQQPKSDPEQRYWNLVEHFYAEAAEALRPHLHERCALFIDTCWDVGRWNARLDTLPQDSVIIDYHYYLCHNHFDPVDELVEAPGLDEVLDASERPVLVGEFSLALNHECPGFDDDMSWPMRYAERQIVQMSVHPWCVGWFFWSYKLGREDLPLWGFRDCIQNGWINPAWWMADSGMRQLPIDGALRTPEEAQLEAVKIQDFEPTILEGHAVGTVAGQPRISYYSMPLGRKPKNGVSA